MGESPVDTLYEQVRALAPVVAEDGPPALVEVAPGIRVLALRTPTLPPAAHTNVYLVGPARGPQLVVDPGSPYHDQQAALDAVLTAEADAGRPLGMIALTHHHGDHLGGAAALARRWGVPVAAHRETAALARGRVDVTRELEEGEPLASFGLTCLHTPGHAAGHLCFEGPQATLAGDMVAGVGTILIDPDEGDMATYLASLRRLRARGARTLLPAHGAPIADGPGKLDAYVAHRLMREERVLAALRGRGEATPEELVPTAYADTPRPLWPLAGRVLLAHLHKLAHDGRAREVAPGRWTAR